jgi:predicted DNA binding CopG/RHH family protein
MATKVRIPKFKSEKEEAEWWDAHPEVVTELFLRAKKAGKLGRLAGTKAATKSVTIRLPVDDIEAAQELAEKRGLPYQTYVKMLLHQALEKERRAS